MSALAGTNPTRGTVGGRGFKQLLRTEGRLLIREPMLVFWALVFPIGLLVVLGLASNKPLKSLGGLKLIQVETPIVMMFTLTLLALSAMPSTLAGYRDKGYLKRLSTTPVGAMRLLAAQLTLILGLAVCEIVLMVLVSHLAFNVQWPQDPASFILTMLLVGLAMSSIGLFISAVASSQRVAGAVGSILFFPMMFFAGLWVPQQEMGETLRDISHYTPLGAAVPAIENSFSGSWAGTTHLIVLLAYGLIFARLAIRFFRWER